MGVCQSSEAQANTAAIEPMQLPSALSPISASGHHAKPLEKQSSQLPSPPSPTVNGQSSSHDSQVERLEVTKSTSATEQKENLPTDQPNPNPIQNTITTPNPRPITTTTTTTATNQTPNNQTPESVDEVSRQRSGSNSQTPVRRTNRSERESVSQQRPVSRRSTSGVSRAAQLFAEWSATAPPPELPTMDRGPRTVIIAAQQPFRSSDAPEPTKVDETVTEEKIN